MFSLLHSPIETEKDKCPQPGTLLQKSWWFSLSTSSFTSSRPLVWIFRRWGKTPDEQYTPVHTWCKRKTEFWNWFARWILLFCWPDSNFITPTALSIFLVMIQMFQQRNAVNSIVNYMGPNSKVFLLPKNIIRKISRNKTHVLFSLKKKKLSPFSLKITYDTHNLKEAHFFLIHTLFTKFSFYMFMLVIGYPYIAYLSLNSDSPHLPLLSAVGKS